MRIPGTGATTPHPPPGLTPHRLGCYLLPGLAADPRDAVEEARQVEQLGLASAWIAEKYDVKDLPSLVGALSTTTRRLRLAAGVTHVGLRHPLAIASMGQTLQALTAGRFAIGFGRAAPRKWSDSGVKPPSMQVMADTAAILRRLWAGETVSYDGPAGRYPALRITLLSDVPPPPLYLAAIGPRMLRLAGSDFDGVILHPFLTPDGVGRSAELARQACEAAGRSPEAFRVFAAVVAAPEGGAVTQLEAASERASRYLMARAIREPLLAINRWDGARLPRARQLDPSLPAAERASVPEDWIQSSSAIGDVADRHRRLEDYLKAGADELILHGAPIQDLAPMVQALAGP